MEWPWSYKEQIVQCGFSFQRYCAACEKYSPHANKEGSKNDICPNCGEYTTECRVALIYREKINCWTGLICTSKYVGLRERVNNGFKNVDASSLIGFE
ncbi:MAG: hypothetical protein M0R17_01935 [Candidatus Omnitrophica bacterium]|jgi:hypothetical protein|nr:hypothetical protein [Candidatus Omnitrophota bacterium]